MGNASNGDHGYDHVLIERRSQELWRLNRRFATPSGPRERRGSYVYACTPFTTGKAHMGHVRSYTIADVCARRARSLGHDVLWAMGFDAFGLPNEMAAIERGIHPADWVRRSREEMTAQFDRLGLSVDWERCFVTSDPEYYRWTQWVFLQFLERGLVHRTEGIESWCDGCHTVLASLQVDEDGKCWRCGAQTRLACVDQWYLRLSPYARELEAGIETLGAWSEMAIGTQRELLTGIQGVELDAICPSGSPLAVFCAHPRALSTAAFVAISPNLPNLEQLLGLDRSALNLEAQRRRGMAREERSTQRLPAIATGLEIDLPSLGRALPVVITTAVDLRFGSGATLGVPSCDPIDAALADQLGLCAREEQGEATPAARPAVRHRLRDSSISRQRGWGAPVPVIHCESCGVVPVPDEDLPVRLPEDLHLTGEGSPLAQHPTFAGCRCSRCGREARRDTDTLDVHIDSIWMLIPFCVPTPARADRMFTHPDLARWLPVEQVVCGADQTGWWINDRFFFKVLADCGYLPHLEAREPVRRLLMHEMVLADGRKMSKSLGNAVDPDDVMASHGADALRLAVLRVKPEKAFSWTTEALDESRRFLAQLWGFVKDLPRDPLGPSPEGAALLRKLRRCRDVAVSKVTRAYERNAFHLVEKELKTFFKKIEQFGARRRASGAMTTEDREEIHECLLQLLELLEPLAPHICDALGEDLEAWGRSRRECTASTHEEVRSAS